MSHPDLPDGYVLIEGDIQVRRESLLPSLAFGGVIYWGLTVPFAFAPNVTAINEQRAIDAMNAISARAGVSFFHRTSQTDYILFNSSTGNNSPVGRQGGQQVINIFNWGTQIVIVHELYHSLGFPHEQSRTDRDTYVTINLENVCQDCCDGQPCDHNFEIRTATTPYGPYDFDSFIHHASTDFGINSQTTILVNQPYTSQWQSAIGQRDHFSVFDEIVCRGIFPYSSDRWWSPGASGNGSGDLRNPMTQSTFAAAYNATPAGGALFIKSSSTYAAIGTYSKAMILRAPIGANVGN